MFHNSTTIRHNYSENNFSFREKRLIFGVWGALKEGAKSAKEQAVKGGGYVKRASMWGPIKYLFPFHYIYKYSAKGAVAAYKKALWAGHTGIEAAKGVIGIREGESMGRGLVDLAVAPIVAIKRLFVGNFRDIIKGVFRTPYELSKQTLSGAYSATKTLFSTSYNAVRHPIKSVIGMKNAVVNTAKSVRNKTANVLDDVMHLHFGKLAKGVRNSVASVITAPFRAVAKPVKTIARTPYEVARNTFVKAPSAYPEAIGKWIESTRGGINRILSAPHTASMKFQAPAAAAAH